MEYNDDEYKKRQAACRCLSPERRSYIQNAISFSDDFSDGAFMAYMDEEGIDMSEFECLSIEHDCKKA